MELTKNKKLVYTAMSKHLAYFKSHVSKFVVEKEGVPLSPFGIFEYFLLDTVDRDKVREANNNLVIAADEVWVFGKVSDGVLAEIKIANGLGKPLRFFKIIKSRKIEEISVDDVEFEEGLENFKREIQ